jgi:hypothetical protein
VDRTDQAAIDDVDFMRESRVLTRLEMNGSVLGHDATNAPRVTS